jgi:multidrug efflux pump subunit AcrA (membrane-fusion protein)
VEHSLSRRVLLILAAALLGCRARPHPEDSPPAASVSAEAVPVRVAKVARATLSDVVSSPGRTAALAQQKIRAPFAGTLTELTVADGDRVTRGMAVGTVVSRDSEAAVAGAREMVREAKTPTEKQDGERALALAERALVKTRIVAPTDGIVFSHAAAKGDRLSEDQEILTIADASSIVFLADVAQSDLNRVRPGQGVEVSLPGRSTPLLGRVHDVLPGANTADFTVPVRVDLPALRAVPPLGLFGTARITVGQRRGAMVVPDAALIHDDVTGSTRIALAQDGRARWVDATVGLHGPQGTEITAPPLREGQIVVVSGQVGLPDGAAVTVRP